MKKVALFVILGIAVTQAVPVDDKYDLRTLLMQRSPQGHTRKNLTHTHDKARPDFKSETTNLAGICGRTSKEESRIAGGTTAGRYEFPWQVIVMDSYEYFYGGVLISNKYVLTTAYATISDYWYVYLGYYDLEDDSETGRISMKATEGIYHPNYDIDTFQNDIGIIKLPTPVAYADGIRPICLPSYSDASVDFTGAWATVTGWGYTSSNDQSQPAKLREVDTEIISVSQCNSVYPDIIGSQLCTAGTGGVGACKGDFGGPLSFYDNRDSLYYLLGISIFNSNTGCELGYPTGFTRITSFLNFIETNTGITIDP